VFGAAEVLCRRLRSQDLLVLTLTFSAARRVVEGELCAPAKVEGLVTSLSATC
jgi:hypothetical protein